MDENATLNQKTLAYWELSRSVRGHGKVVTVERAIRQSKDAMSVLNPARKLWEHLAELQNQVIEHGGIKRTKKTKKSNVLKLNTSNN